MLCAVAERHRGADQSRGCSSTNPSWRATPCFRSLQPNASMRCLTRKSITGRLDASQTAPARERSGHGEKPMGVMACSAPLPSGTGEPFPPRGIVRTKPRAHPSAIRTTNLPERLFVEERRRLKITPNAFGEKAVLKLMFGAMIRAAERWRAIRVSELECRQMRAVFRLSPDLPGLRDRTLFLRRDSPGLSGISGISGIPRGARPSREARPNESCGRSRPHRPARSRTA